MNKRRILRPSIRNLVIPTFAGIISAAGYGIFELYNQSTLDSNNLPTLSSLPEAMQKSEELKVQENMKEESQSTSAQSIQVGEISSNVTPSPTSQTAENKYPVDDSYLKTVGSNSMASKYRDYLVLSPANASIWEEKAKKLRELAEKSEYKMV